MKKILLAVLALCSTAVLAQPAAAPTLRVRGTVLKVDAATLVVRDRIGETTTLALADNLSVSEVLPIDPTTIQQGSFVGIASLPAPDGTLAALEVLVFAESMRGTGEGHSPWDLHPGSQMTNATVAAIAPGTQGRTMTLRYKDGEKSIFVPDGVPVVTLKPGDRSLLVPGAKVIVTAQVRNGQPTALRVTAGRNGFQPPM
jgi:hypothetical protein